MIENQNAETTVSREPASRPRRSMFEFRNASGHGERRVPAVMPAGILTRVTQYVRQARERAAIFNEQ